MSNFKARKPSNLDESSKTGSSSNGGRDVIVLSDYDDFVTQQDIDALNEHVREHFGEMPSDAVLVAGPAW